MLLSILRFFFHSILLDSRMQLIKNCMKSKLVSKREDHVLSNFALRTIIEQTLQFQQKLNLKFVDFVKGFDSVHRPFL